MSRRRAIWRFASSSTGARAEGRDLPQDNREAANLLRGASQ